MGKVDIRSILSYGRKRVDRDEMIAEISPIIEDVLFRHERTTREFCAKVADRAAKERFNAGDDTGATLAENIAAAIRRGE